MDEIKGLQGQVGFFNPDGSVRNAQQEAKAQSILNKGVQTPGSQAPAVLNETQGTSISQALRAERGRVNEQFKASAGVVAEKGDELKATRTLVKQEIDIAKQLKQAIEDEDDDRQLELKEKLRQVDVQREQLELRIGENNRARRGQELQSISLGNQRVGTAEINTQIDLSRIDSPAVDDLTDQRAVNDFIKARKVERDNINSQIDQTKSEKDQLRGIAREARRSLNEIERTEERAAEELSGPIESILQAQQEVGRVASAISSSGLSGALQQPLRPDSPDAKVVQRLLGS